MAGTVLYIKNMVCPRCIKVVREELTKLNFQVKHIELGKVEINELPDTKQWQNIEKVLLENGFELLDDNNRRLIEQVKTEVINLIHYEKEKAAHINASDYLSEKFSYEYSYLSSLFSSIEGATIEKYIINQKIEKVKELLVYDELTLSEIAYQLGYSSVQHLSNQFKKNTGFSPSGFKKSSENGRKSLDKV